jgi:hypothetical protein
VAQWVVHRSCAELRAVTAMGYGKIHDEPITDFSGRASKVDDDRATTRTARQSNVSEPEIRMELGITTESE